MTTTPTREYWPTAGWRTADPAALGIDPVALDQAVDVLAQDYPNLDSLLVVRGGVLVFEQYLHARAGRDVLRNIKSATKSVTGALVGIALAQGDLASVDQMLGALLPDAFTSTSDTRTRSIRVRDLLTMQSGLAWEEWRGTTIQMLASANWIDFVLHRPQALDPGTAFNYSTGDTQVLAAILQQHTGLPLLDYADNYLFGPLGIDRRRWPTDPQGIHIGGAELELRARDMAKFGYLLLNDGVWAGERILPPGWVRDAFRAHGDANPDGDGDCVPLHYGYLWWLRDQGEHPSALAVGYGGQYIIVIPALDMVVVITGDVANVPKRFSDNRMLCQFNLVQDVILPGVSGQTVRDAANM